MDQIAAEGSWARAVVPGRSDIIGVRSLPDGSYEFLVHDEALPWPYYVTVTGGGTSWHFEWDRDKKAYVQTAASVAEQS